MTKKKQENNNEKLFKLFKFFNNDRLVKYLGGNIYE